MLIQGWDFDFASLKYWDNHGRIPYLTDDFFQNETSDVVCVIYSIAEVTMCNYLGFLAILRNKKNPELVLNVTNFLFPQQEVTFSSDGNLIFLKGRIFFREKNAIEYPLIVINVKNNCFAYIKRDNHNISYRIEEQNASTFTIEADEFHKRPDKLFNIFSSKKIKLKKLTWHGIEELKNLPEMLLNHIR